MENNEVLIQPPLNEQIQAAQIEVLTKGLFDLYVFFMQLKANKRTKVPTINLSREDGLKVLEHINYLTSIVGKWIEVIKEEDGSFIMNMIDIPQEG